MGNTTSRGGKSAQFSANVHCFGVTLEVCDKLQAAVTKHAKGSEAAYKPAIDRLRTLLNIWSDIGTELDRLSGEDVLRVARAVDTFEVKLLKALEKAQKLKKSSKVPEAKLTARVNQITQVTDDLSQSCIVLHTTEDAHLEFRRLLLDILSLNLPRLSGTGVLPQSPISPADEIAPAAGTPRETGRLSRDRFDSPLQAPHATATLAASPSAKQDNSKWARPALGGTAAALDSTPIIAGEAPHSEPADTVSRDSVPGERDSSGGEAVAAPQPVLGAVAAALTEHEDEIQPDEIELQESEDMLGPLEPSAAYDSQAKSTAAEGPSRGLIKARQLLSVKLEGPQGQPKPWAQPPKDREGMLAAALQLNALKARQASLSVEDPTVRSKIRYFEAMAAVHSHPIALEQAATA